MPAFACPACQRPLYNRRRATCEFCGNNVPANLRLSPAQQDQFESMKRADRQRHQGTAGYYGGGSDTGGVGFLDIGGGGDGDCGGGCD